MNNELTSTQDSRSLAERLKAQKVDNVLLLDVSESMTTDVEPGKSRYEALCDIVRGIKGAARVFAFSSYINEVTYYTVPKPHGSTALHLALEFLKNLVIKNVILITDGHPDSAPLALKAAEGMRIQIMYVGGEEKPAFLDDLARQCGGFCTVDDLSQTKELTDKVQKLLGSGKVEERGTYMSLKNVKTKKPKFLLTLELTDQFAGTYDDEGKITPITLAEVKDGLMIAGVTYKVKEFRRIQ